MYKAGFELDSFEVIPVDERCALVLALCDALVATNRAYLKFRARTGYGTPQLYMSGVRYQDQTLGADKWKDIPRLLSTRRGACEDLASWRVAELHMFGERGAYIDVDTYPLRDKDGEKVIYHVVVVRGNGLREDPSALLGMNSVTGG